MIAAGGPAGNTRSTRAGTSTERPAPSVTLAARARCGSSREAERPVTTVRRSSRGIKRFLLFAAILSSMQFVWLLSRGLKTISPYDARLNNACVQCQQHELCIEAFARLQRGLDPALDCQHDLRRIGAGENVGSDHAVAYDLGRRPIRFRHRV